MIQEDLLQKVRNVETENSIQQSFQLRFDHQHWTDRWRLVERWKPWR